MAATINDKIIQAQNGGAPQPTTVSSARSISGTSLSCVALTNWPTAAVHLITYKKKTDGTMDRSTLCLWKGIVSGTTIGTLTLKGGTDAGNAVGDFVELAPTSAQWQDLYDGLTQTLNIDGTLKDNIVTSAKINASAVGTSALADGAVTYGKLLSTIFSGVATSYTNTGSAGGTFKYVNLGGIKLLWGVSGTYGIGSSTGVTNTVTLPSGFFSNVELVIPLLLPQLNVFQYANVASYSTSSITINTINASGTTPTADSYFLFVIGN